MKLPRRHHLNRALGKLKKSDPIDMQALVMHQISFFCLAVKKQQAY